MSNNMSIINSYNKPRVGAINFNNSNTSTIATNNTLVQDSYTKSSQPEQDKNLKSKFLIGLGILVAATLGIFYLRRGKVKSTITNQPNTSPLAKDVLGYEIKPPKIEHISGAKYPQSKEFPLQVEYYKILDNINEDPKTSARYTEILKNLKNTAAQVNNKFKEIDSSANFSGLGLERAILQKRYFSLPGNHKEGYCCLDPLLFKAAREEALDIQIGYHLLEPFQLGKKPDNSLLNSLKARYASSITQENLNFIDECVNRLSPEDAFCCGHESKFHAYELAKLGKIIRTTMGIEVL